MRNTTEELTLEAAKKISQHAMQAAGVIGICNIERLGRDITTRTLARVANVLKCPAWQIVKDWEDAQSACESASSGQDVSDAKPNLP